MADHRLAQHGFDSDLVVDRPLGLAPGSRTEITHTVNEVRLCLRGLFCDVLKTLLSEIPIKTPDALIDFFLRREPALVVKVAGPDHIEARFCQE